jgi:hypothetical protein
MLPLDDDSPFVPIRTAGYEESGKEIIMSDFVSGFWNIYVVGIVLVSIIGCGVFLWIAEHVRGMSKVRNHGSRLGRGSAGVQQSAAQLVAVAVLHHDRLFAVLSGDVSGSGNLQRVSLAGHPPDSTKVR